MPVGLSDRWDRQGIWQAGGMTESRWRNAQRRIVAADLVDDDRVMPATPLAGGGGMTVRRLDRASRRERSGEHGWMLLTFAVCMAGIVTMGPSTVAWIASLSQPGWLEIGAFVLTLVLWTTMAYWVLIILGYWRFRLRQRRARRLSRRRR